MAELLDWLRSEPLPLLVLTVAAYWVGLRLRELTNAHPVAQPVLVAIVIVAPVLLLADIDYSAYAEGTEFITFLLGPATVALAIPLHRQISKLRGFVLPLAVAIPIGSAVAIATAIGVVRLLGGTEELALTLAPRAATTPVSIAVSAELGGISALTAALTIVSGILGAVAGPTVLTLLRVRDPRVRGIATGGSSHGIGTSRVLLDSETEGAFSGLAMGLTALTVSVLTPVAAAFM